MEILMYYLYLSLKSQSTKTFLPNLCFQNITKSFMQILGYVSILSGNMGI